MPKAKKQKVTQPHGMLLRRRVASQSATSAGQAHVSVASPASNSIPAPARSQDNVVRPPPSLPPQDDNLCLVPSTPLPVSAPKIVVDYKERVADTQILSVGNGFSEAIIANLANVDAIPAIAVNPPIPVVSVVSRLRREFAQLSNLDLSCAADEELETQEVTQAVAARPFSEREINGLGNVHQSVATEEDLVTQVVVTEARFSEAALEQLENVDPMQAAASEAETQVVASVARFSRGLAAELGNVDLVNIAIAPTRAIEDDDYDDGTTIKCSSQVPKSDTISVKEVEQAPSKYTTIKSWASGSLTTSMRDIVGLPPKPLKSGKIRPVLEDLGPSPARWPCEITAMHPTCGHTYRTVVHSHLCYYSDFKPGEQIYKGPILDEEILDEWGLPPSGQQQRSEGSAGSKTQVMTEDDEECFETTSSIRLTGALCETCRAEQGGRKYGCGVRAVGCG